MTDVVIPIKALSQAKGRLRNVLTPGQRSGLVLAMLHDLLKALGQCALGNVWLVASDDAVFDLGADFGARMLRESVSHGYNTAVALGLGAVRKDAPVVVLPGDVPFARPRDIDALTVPPSATREVRIVADHLGTGTNALYLTAPELISPQFGPSSLRDHMAAGKMAGLRTRTLFLPGLTCDIDRPRDVARLAAVARGEAAGYLRSLGLDWRTFDQSTQGAA